MITLYRKPADQKADEIEERFNNLVVAYKTEIYESIEECYIKEDDKQIPPGPGMENWFRQLTDELDWQRSLSGDGCYIDPESGQVC